VQQDASFVDLMREISAKGLGATAVIDAQRKVLGVFTDGDLRRAIEGGQDLRQSTAQELMRPHPRTIGAEALAAEAADLMEQHRISCLFVLDEQGQLCGALNTHDLMRAKVI
jgi:arabinose-5-phosphate isomerase